MFGERKKNSINPESHDYPFITANPMDSVCSCSPIGHPQKVLYELDNYVKRGHLLWSKQKNILAEL